MDYALINTTATHETRNEPQEGVPKPSASPVLGGSCAPSTGTNLVCRLVQIALALYLIPALLIVLLEGAEMMDRHDSPADDNAVVPRFPSRPDADESNGAMWREPPLTPVGNAVEPVASL